MIPKKPIVPSMAIPTVDLPSDCRRREQWIEMLAKEHGWTRGAELGVWMGRTFLHLLRTCPDLTMIGVDLWEPQPNNSGPENYIEWPHQVNEQRVRDGAAEFGDRAIIHKMWTDEAAALVEDKSLDFIFVDADHSTEAVRNDFLTWLPKVKDDGMLIGHDSNWPTVRIVMDELFNERYVLGPDNAWAAWKDNRTWNDGNEL